MVEHKVKIIEDGSLATGEGWAVVRCRDTGDVYFIAERSAVVDEQVLADAWRAARLVEGDAPQGSGSDSTLRRVV